MYNTICIAAIHMYIDKQILTSSYMVVVAVSCSDRIAGYEETTRHYFCGPARLVTYNYAFIFFIKYDCLICMGNVSCMHKEQKIL